MLISTQESMHPTCMSACLSPAKSTPQLILMTMAYCCNLADVSIEVEKKLEELFGVSFDDVAVTKKDRIDALAEHLTFALPSEAVLAPSIKDMTFDQASAISKSDAANVIIDLLGGPEKAAVFGHTITKYARDPTTLFALEDSQLGPRYGCFSRADDMDRQMYLQGGGKLFFIKEVKLRRVRHFARPDQGIGLRPYNFHYVADTKPGGCLGHHVIDWEQTRAADFQYFRVGYGGERQLQRFFKLGRNDVSRAKSTKKFLHPPPRWFTRQTDVDRHFTFTTKEPANFIQVHPDARWTDTCVTSTYVDNALVQLEPDSSDSDEGS